MRKILFLILMLASFGAFGASPSFQQMTNYVTNALSGYIATNTIGSQVNARTAGFLTSLESSSANTTNRWVLSNLVANGVSDIYIPAGTWPLRNGLVFPSNLPPVTLTGDNGKTIITNINAGVIIDAQSAGCVFSGITFTEGLSNVPTSGTKVFINLNSVGFPKIENCNFVNISGACIYAGGDGGINNRSNHCLIANNTFSNIYNGIVTATNNQFEYGSIIGNRMTVLINDGISGGSANVLVENNNINGWKDYSGGSGSATSTGLRWMSDNGRSHSKFIGNIFNHHKFDCILSNLTTTADFIGNDFSGGQSNVIINCTDMTFVGNRFEPFNGTIMSGCSRMSFGYNHFFTNLFGFSGCAYSGGPNFYTDGSAYTFDCQTANTLTLGSGGIIFQSGFGFTNFFITNVVIDFPSTSVGAVAAVSVTMPTYPIATNDVVMVNPANGSAWGATIGSVYGVPRATNIDVIFVPTALTQDPASQPYRVTIIKSANP